MRIPSSSLLLLALGTGCGAAFETRSAPAEVDIKAQDESNLDLPYRDEAMKKETAAAGGMPAAPAAVAEAAPPPMDGDGSEREGKVGGKDDNSLARVEKRKGGPAGAGAEAPETRVRQWFPEAFLWQPLVETDASGRATVDVRVPDQLTTWRVLALAHDRQGRQAGAVATFDSRLPLYADPVVPAWLYAGDVLDLPVQLVNAGDTATTGTLDVVAEGALTGGGTGPVSLPAGGSDVERVRLVASGAGTGRIRVDLGGDGAGDAVIREFPVIPQGRPVTVERGGGLSAARTFVLDGPDDSDPATRSVDVRVFAGPLSVVGAELERIEAAGVPDGAYGFALASRLAQLPGASAVDPKRTRALQVLAWQGVVRAARDPDAGVAADLLAGLGAVAGDELVDGLRPRLLRAVAQGQRGDGAWSRRGDATLQEVVVETAWVARSLPASEETARRRAAGALERFAPMVADPYTAAMVLSTGLVTGAREAALRKILADALVTGADGATTLPTPSGVVDPWGVWPARAEVLAAAVLALEPGAARDDLLGSLLADWSGSWGFGAGHADPMALEAVVAAMPALDRKVSVVLTIDGREVGRADLDPTQPLAAANLSGTPTGPDPSVGIRTEPALPGLAYAATARSYVPWSGSEALPGIEAKITSTPLRVGEESWLVLELAGPSGARLVAEQGLAPGVAVDAARVQVPAGCGVEVVGDRLRITTAAFGAGETQTIRVPVRPSLPGRFSTTALVLSAAGQRAAIRPMTWTVAPEGGA